jgi:hypothetical protein
LTTGVVIESVVMPRPVLSPNQNKNCPYEIDISVN